MNPTAASAITTAVALGAAAGTLGFASMWPENQLFGKTLIAGSDPSLAALTFDDGPNGDTTLRLLEILAEAGAPATFFLIGNYARQQPEVVRRIVAAGHAIGNHTMTHPHLALVSAASTRRQLVECNAMLQDISGCAVSYFRPPFGSRRPATLCIARELGLQPVMWNAAGVDWSLRDEAAIAARVMRGVVRNQAAWRGSNILLHDGSHLSIGYDRTPTLGAVSRLVKDEQMRRIVSLRELCNIAAA